MSEVAFVIKEMQEARADWQRMLDARNAEVAKMNLTLANRERQSIYTDNTTQIQNRTGDKKE
tara:strand:- start:1138 stop:1323 length:186 start_codon:yes stop_codon:yes gene_type:complete